MSDFVPPSPTSLVLQGLEKGMISNTLAGDALKIVQGLIVRPTGLERRPAWIPAFGQLLEHGRINLDEDELVQDIVPFWATDGTFSYIAITNKRLWQLEQNATTWTSVPFYAESLLAASSDATSITVSGATFLSSGVRVGDYAIVEPLQVTERATSAGYYGTYNTSITDITDGVRLVTGAYAATYYAGVGLRYTIGHFGNALDTYNLRIRLDSGSAGVYSIRLLWVENGTAHQIIKNVDLQTSTWTNVAFELGASAYYVGKTLDAEAILYIDNCYPCTFTIAYMRSVFPFATFKAQKAALYNIIGNCTVSNAAEGVAIAATSGALSEALVAACGSLNQPAGAADIFRARIRLDSGSAGQYSIGVYCFNEVGQVTIAPALYTLRTNEWVDVEIAMPSTADYVNHTVNAIGLSTEAPCYPLGITCSEFSLETDYGVLPITGVTETVLSFTSVPPTFKSAFYLERRFALDEGFDLVDYTQTPSGLVLTDNSVGGIIKFEGTYAEAFGQHAADSDPDADYLTGARTVLYFAGLLWLGGTHEVGSDGSKFIRWSSLTDLTEFPADQYIAFTRETSSVRKLSANEDIPIVYLENAIYTGYPSDVNPFDFKRVELGSIALVGPRAIASAGGGQFFIASDNFYFLASGRQGTAQTVAATPIGTVVSNESLRRTSWSLHKAQVIYDRNNELVYFVLPDAAGLIERTFIFSMQSKAWSFVDRPAGFFVAMCVIPRVDSASTWSSLSGTTWTDLNPTTWGAFTTRTSLADVCAIATDGTLYARSDGADDDLLILGRDAMPTAQSIQAEVVTGDLDFGAPDADKVLTRIALQLEDSPRTARSANASFDLELSADSGRSWTPKGSIALEPGSDIDEAHFRFRASRMRLRLVSRRTPAVMLKSIIARVRPGELHNERHD
jgi:hypothetical protein